MIERGARRGGPADPCPAARPARRRRASRPRARRSSTCSSSRPCGESSCAGPMVGKQHAYVLVRDWLGEPQPVDRDAALAELARRYLVGHAPARRPRPGALGGAAAARRPRRPRGDRLGAGGARGRPVHLRGPAPRREAAAAAPARRLRPEPARLDLTRGDPRRPRTADRTGGIFRPFALVGGRAVAIWKWAGERVEIDPLEDISGRASKALQRDAADVARFLKI